MMGFLRITAGDMAVQTLQTLANLRLVLELAGMGMDDVVKTTVMLTDWRYYAAYNAVYRGVRPLTAQEITS